jgi:hypothetical protein
MREAITATMSAAVTDPNSLPSSPARAVITSGPPEISFDARASYSPFWRDRRLRWERCSVSACLRAPFSALTASPRGIR